MANEGRPRIEVKPRGEIPWSHPSPGYEEREEQRLRELEAERTGLEQQLAAVEFNLGELSRTVTRRLAPATRTPRRVLSWIEQPSTLTSLAPSIQTPTSVGRPRC